MSYKVRKNLTQCPLLNEANTRAKLIGPSLQKDGWDEEKIRRDVYITPAKIIDGFEKTKREKA